MEKFLQDHQTIFIVTKSFYFWAALFIFIMLWAFFIKKLFFAYPRKIYKVLIPTQHGTVSISGNAIAHLVKKQIDEICDIKLKKISLYETKVSYFLIVKLMISSHIEGNIVNLMEEIQRKILNALNERYGIANIESVHVHIIGEAE